MLLNTYSRLPISFVRGRGCHLYDEHDNSYLDAISGVAVCNLGHCHPAITEVIAQQAGQLVHVSNLFRIPEQEKLSEQLLSLSGLSGVFFSNSGSEANETAVKIIRQWGQLHSRPRSDILCFRRAFHGRTLAMIAAAANPVHIKGFDPLPQGFFHCPSPDITLVRKMLQDHPSIAAVMIEPIQGEGGVIVHSFEFLLAVQELCRQHQCLLFLDEVQTGAGRTGHYFNHLYHKRLKPDIVTVAKGLGNGFPVGASLVNRRLFDVLYPGSHGCTFGGNPLACSVSSKVIEVLEQEGLYAHARQTGGYLLKQLSDALGRHQRVQRIEGCGMMIGVELADPPPFNLPAEVLKRSKVLVNLTAGKTIRLLPPLILERTHADQIAEAVIGVIEQDSLYAKAS